MKAQKALTKKTVLTKKKNETEEFINPALVMGGVGIAIGVANFVNGTVRGEMTKAKLNEIERKIDNVLNNQKDIINQLAVILTEIHWNTIIAQLAPAVESINYSCKSMLSLTEGEDSTAQDWANGVLNMNNGIAKDLSIIEDVIYGSEILSEPIIKLYVDKISKLKSDQSEYYMAMSYLRLLFNIQEKGYIILANAYSYLNQEKEVSDFLKPYEGKLFEQLTFNKKYIEGLNQFYKNPVYGNEFYDTHSHNHYVDTQQTQVADDTVLTGIALNLHGNRLALKVKAATLFPNGLVNDSYNRWRVLTPSGKTDFFDIGKDANHYVDTTLVEVPEGHVVVAAALYKKNNRLAIKLQSTKIDLTTGKIDNNNRVWTLSPGDGHGKDNFFDTSGGNHYINTANLDLNPASYITGAQLFLFGNRTAIKVKTSFFGFDKLI